MLPFVLTPKEKRVIVFVLASLLLGLSAKAYRAKHPVAPLPAAKARTHAIETGPRR